MLILMSVCMQVSASDWEESFREEVLQFDFRSSLFDTVVSIDNIRV